MLRGFRAACLFVAVAAVAMLFAAEAGASVRDMIEEGRR